VLGAVGALAYLLFGGGGKTYSIPLVNGLPQARAQQQIAAAHLKSTVVDQPDTTVAKGNVIKSNPVEGNNVPANTVVTLYVSTGPQKVTVPNVTGESAGSAASALSAKGLSVNQLSDPNSTKPKGTVTRQTPPPNSSVNPQTTVTIYVSGGGVTVPGVVGDSVSEAQNTLSGAGFKVATKMEPGPAGSTPGDVFSQTPTANTSVPQNSTVTILVAAQPASNPTTSAPAPTPSQTQGGNPTPSPSQSGGFGGFGQNGGGKK
jgi:eukaryotic-like serine/threonine-protein kinase